MRVIYEGDLGWAVKIPSLVRSLTRSETKGRDHNTKYRALLIAFNLNEDDEISFIIWRTKSAIIIKENCLRS